MLKSCTLTWIDFKVKFDEQDFCMNFLTSVTLKKKQVCSFFSFFYFFFKQYIVSWVDNFRQQRERELISAEKEKEKKKAQTQQQTPESPGMPVNTRYSAQAPP